MALDWGALNYPVPRLEHICQNIRLNFMVYVCCLSTGKAERQNDCWESEATLGCKVRPNSKT